MREKTVLVVGDAMFDLYWEGTADRISPEAPIPVVKLSHQRGYGEGAQRVLNGGAGNVADNLWELGVKVVEVFQSVRPLKNRLMVGNTQIARWDDDRCSEIELGDFPEEASPSRIDALVISDYRKGAITPEIREYLFETYGHLPVFIDTKGNPADYWEFEDATFFPNRSEFEEYRWEYAGLPKVALKKGSEGMEYLEFGKLTQSVPATGVSVLNVTGAGDSALAGYVAAYLSYPSNPYYALSYANRVAGIAVSKPFTARVSDREVRG